MRYPNRVIDPSATAAPTFVALVADDYLDSDDSLDNLIEQLLSDGGDHEVCVWDRYDSIAAVVFADGTVHRFDAPRSAPALEACGRTLAKPSSK